MSVIYKIRLENFNKFELDYDDNALVPFFIQPEGATFASFKGELEKRNSILKNLNVGKGFKLFYRDADGDKIEIKDEYDYRFFVRKGITNVIAEMEPHFNDFEEYAEYVKMLSPDGKFPGFQLTEFIL